MISLPSRVPTTPPAAGGKPGVAAWAKKNPTLALGGAGIGVVVLVALMSKKSAAGTGTVDPITGLPVTAGQITPNQGGYYDSTANDVYNSLMGQMQTLQAQITGLTPGAADPTPTPTSATPAPKVETTAQAFDRRHAAYLTTPAGVAATARVDARATAAAAANAAAASYARRHAAYLLTPAGVAAVARNKK